jgi:hypothetical protein
MIPLALALGLVAQYPSAQAPMYGAPPPAQYAAPQTFSVPVTYAAPQVTMLGAGAVIPPGPFGLFLGHLGQKLERHAWPRVQPVMAQPAVAQTVYLQMSAPVVQQAMYTVPAPTYAAPPVQYAAPPQPMKNPPTQYGSPQAPQGGMYGAQQQQQQQPAQYGATGPGPAATKPDEGAPPVPKR